MSGSTIRRPALLGCLLAALIAACDDGRVAVVYGRWGVASLSNCRGDRDVIAFSAEQARFSRDGEIVDERQVTYRLETVGGETEIAVRDVEAPDTDYFLFRLIDADRLELIETAAGGESRAPEGFQLVRCLR